MKHVSPNSFLPVTVDDRAAAGLAFLERHSPDGWIERLLSAPHIIVGDKMKCPFAAATGMSYVDACSHFKLDYDGDEVKAYGFQMVAPYVIEQTEHGDTISPEWIVEMEALTDAWRRALAAYKTSLDTQQVAVVGRILDIAA